jgi:hypothetical protein
MLYQPLKVELALLCQCPCVANMFDVVTPIAESNEALKLLDMALVVMLPNFVTTEPFELCAWRATDATALIAVSGGFAQFLPGRSTYAVRKFTSLSGEGTNSIVKWRGCSCWVTVLFLSFCYGSGGSGVTVACWESSRPSFTTSFAIAVYSTS